MDNSLIVGFNLLKISFMTDFTFLSIPNKESSALSRRPASSYNYGSLLLKPTELSLMDNLVVINHFVILEAYGKLNPIDPPLHCAPLAHHMACLHLSPPWWLRQVNHCDGEFLLAYPWTQSRFAMRDYS
jgi:hypothetical protein